MDYEKVLEDFFITSKGLNKDNYFNPQRPHIDNLDVMVRRLRNLINKKVSFLIIGDYDVDGICSSDILKEGLKAAGANSVRILLPCRYEDGYGLKTYMVESATEDVIITVDNGISAHEAVARAKELGKEVLIVDHHEPKLDEKGNIVLPEADIIIDPKAFGNKENDFCGAGLSLTLVEYLTNKAWVVNRCYILAALATIADVVDVKGWNRKIIEYGLYCLNNNINVPKGLKKVMEHNCLNTVNANTLAFKVIPVLNAPGRMIPKGAMKSLELLNAETWDEATTIKDVVIDLNIKRQEATKTGTEKAIQIIEDECLYGDVIPIFLEDTIEGVLGIIAGRIAEKYNCTCGVFSNATTKDGIPIYKGSFRSINYNIKAILDDIDKTGNILVYGGHEGAAGISVERDKKIPFFSEIMQLNLDKYKMETVSTDTSLEVEVEADKLNEFYNSLVKYEPFGAGNKPPKVKVTNMSLYPRNGNLFSILGEANDTVKLFGKGFSAIGFNLYGEYKKIGEPKRLNLVGTINKTFYGKSEELQIEISSFEAVEVKTSETSLSQALRERMKFF